MTLAHWREPALLAWLLVLPSGMACVGPGAPGKSESTVDPSGSAAQPPAAPRRIYAAFMSNPPSLANRVNQTVAGGRTSAGIRDLQDVINSGLTVVEEGGAVRPRLATVVPSVENGLWRMLPDGRAETTWQLRTDALWHDGTAFTVEDVLFTARLARDVEVPLARAAGYDLVESIEAVDSRTVRVLWRQPYIQADLMFNGDELVPRHLLEANYLEDKAAVPFHPYWTTAYVGLGPFKVRHFERSSHLVLEANDRYILGRPRVHEIEIKFLPDPNALSANLLAGAVQLSIGQNLSLETAVQVAAQWREGRLEAAPAGGNPLHIFPQFINPNPPIIGDVRFRRALAYALDRQELVKAMLAGRGEIAHGILWGSSDREWSAVESALVRYDFDPLRAAQLVEGLGYTRAPDGIFRDAAGQRLTVELRTLASFDTSVRALYPVADYWQRVGVGVETLVVPEQRQADREYRATRPGFDLPRSPKNLLRLHGREVALPENNFRGDNRARYANPEFDALIDGYFGTVPWDQRMGILRQVVHHMTDQVTVIGLFFDVTPAMIGNSLLNVRVSPEGTATWNAHEWDVLQGGPL